MKDETKMSRRKFLGLTASAGAAAVAGCTDNSGTGTNTVTQNPTEKTTQTDTTTEPEENTPTETETPQPDLTFDEIYEEQMVNRDHVGIDDESNPVDQYWNTIVRELENDGHILDSVISLQGSELSEFMEDLAAHTSLYVEEEYAAGAVAKAAYEKLGMSTEQVIVDARTAVVGREVPTASLLIQNDEGDGYLKDLFMPLGIRHQPDNDNESLAYLNHDEEQTEGAEVGLQDIWNDEVLRRGSMLDISAIRESVDEGVDVDWDYIDRKNDDLVIGYEGDDAGEIGYTSRAEDQLDRLDPDVINGDPSGAGQQAYDLVTGATEFFHNNVKDVEGVFMEVDYRNGEFNYNQVGRERHEELKTTSAS